MRKYSDYRAHYKKNCETSFGSHSGKPDKNAINEAIDHDATHALAPLGKLTDDHKHALDDYTSSSVGVNGYLHDKYNSVTPMDQYSKHAKVLTDALDQSKTLGDMDLYTGIKYSPAKHFSAINGAVPESIQLHMPAFTSTSSSRAQANNFSKDVSHSTDKYHGINHVSARHILKIHVPKGTSAASLRDISPIPTEQEVLLNRGHNIELDRDPVHLGHNVYQWNARVISHTPKSLD